MKKIKLNKLMVKSFVTVLDSENIKTAKGGVTHDYTVFECLTGFNALCGPTNSICNQK